MSGIMPRVLRTPCVPCVGAHTRYPSLIPPWGPASLTTATTSQRGSRCGQQEHEQGEGQQPQQRSADQHPGTDKDGVGDGGDGPAGTVTPGAQSATPGRSGCREQI